MTEIKEKQIFKRMRSCHRILLNICFSFISVIYMQAYIQKRQRHYSRNVISPVFSSIASTIARDSKCVCFLKKSPPGWNPFSITTPAPTSSAPESLTNFAYPSNALPLARKSSISNTRSPSPKNSLDTMMS